MLIDPVLCTWLYPQITLQLLSVSDIGYIIIGNVMVTDEVTVIHSAHSCGACVAWVNGAPKVPTTSFVVPTPSLKNVTSFHMFVGTRSVCAVLGLWGYR